MGFKYQLRDHLENLEQLDYIKKDSEVYSKPKSIVDCSFGVNPFGYSKTISKHSIIDKTDIQGYPPFPYNNFKNKIIEFWNGTQRLSWENIHICSGSMLILDSINTLFIDKGDKVLGYSPQFPEYVNSVRIRGGKYVAVQLKRENNFKFIVSDFIDRLREDKFKLVYIDNPNNPTGQIINIKCVESIISEASRLGICVLVDEAYDDYMSNDNSAISLIGKYDNVFVIRSFSKGYALAGMRIGYVVTSEELSSYYSIIDDFLLNPIGLEAASISLMDQQFLKETISRTTLIKEKLVCSFTKIKVLETNNQVPIFVLEHPHAGVNLADLLLSKGVATTSGFDNLHINTVRMRIPKEINPLLSILNKIEESI